MNILSKCCVVVGLGLAMVGCNDSDSDDNGSNSNGLTEKSFEVSIVNLSANQPFSPVAILYHQAAHTSWAIGESASESLEMLAEGGDNSALISQANASTSVWTTASSDAPIVPGAASTVTTTFESDADLSLTVVSMLVNSNDAFSGLQGWDLSGLAVGDQVSQLAPVYDAGTEQNTEGENTIPGPADGGEGFNAERDDVDFVARHPGIVAAAIAGGFDENSLSVLDSSHRFDAPIAKIVVRRLN